MEPIEVLGHWWLPEAPDKKVPGTLTITAAGRSELTLNGSLRDRRYEGVLQPDGSRVLTPASRAEFRRYPRIAGWAANRDFTLDQCEQTRRNNLGTHPEWEKIDIGQVYRGLALGKDEPTHFTAIYVGLDWLLQWIGETGIAEPRDGVPGADATLTLTDIATRQIVAADGAKIELIHQHTPFMNGLNERGFRQDFIFKISYPNLVPIEELLVHASDLRDLVSIASGQRSAYNFIKLDHPKAMTSGMRQAADVFIQWSDEALESPRPLQPYDMVFDFATFGGMASVEQWLQKTVRYRGAIRRAVAAHTTPEVFASDKFFNITAAVEGYDAIVNQNPFGKLPPRLEGCAAKAKAPFTNLIAEPDATIWAEKCKNYRDDIAHHKPRALTTGIEHYFYGLTMYWLFVFCMLREMDADDAVFGKMCRNPKYLDLQAHLAGM